MSKQVLPTAPSPTVTHFMNLEALIFPDLPSSTTLFVSCCFFKPKPQDGDGDSCFYISCTSNQIRKQNRDFTPLGKAQIGEQRSEIDK